MSDSAEPAIDAGVSELTSDVLDNGSPSTSEPSQAPAEPSQPSASVATDTSQPAATAPAQPAQAAQPAQPAQPAKTFKYLGREYTSEQIANDPSLLTAIVTSANQLPAQSQKVQELLEAIVKSKLGAEPAARPEAQTVAAPTLTQASVRAAFDGAVKQAVAAGYISDDFTQLYPDESSQMMLHRDLLYDVREAVRGILERSNAQEGNRVVESVNADFSRAVDSLAGIDEVYGPLRDPGVKGAFMDFVRGLDPKVGQVKDIATLGRFWAAYNNDAYIAAQRAARAASVAQPARPGSAAVASSPRPGALAPVVNFADHESLVSDVLGVARR